MAVTLPISVVFILIMDFSLLLYIILRLFLKLFYRESYFIPYFSASVRISSLFSAFEKIKSSFLSKPLFSSLVFGHSFGIGILVLSLIMSISGCTLFIVAFARFNSLRYLDVAPYLLWKSFDASANLMIPYTGAITSPFLFSTAEWLIHASFIIMELGIGLILTLHIISSHLLHSAQESLQSSLTTHKQLHSISTSSRTLNQKFLPTWKLRFLVFIHYSQVILTLSLLISITLLFFLNQPLIFPGLPVYSVWTTIDYIIFSLFLLLALKLFCAVFFTTSYLPSKSHIFIAFVSSLFLSTDFIFFNFFPQFWNERLSYILQYSIVLFSTIPKNSLMLVFFHLPLPFICEKQLVDISSPFDLFPQVSTSDVGTNIPSPPPPNSISLSIPTAPILQEIQSVSSSSFMSEKVQSLFGPTAQELIVLSQTGPLRFTSTSPEVLDSYPTFNPNKHRPPRSTLSWIRRTHAA